MCYIEIGEHFQFHHLVGDVEERLRIHFASKFFCYDAVCLVAMDVTFRETGTGLRTADCGLAGYCARWCRSRSRTRTRLF